MRAVVKSFNPSQVQFTLKRIYLKAGVVFLFQSLTGSIHTCMVLKFLTGVQCFNPSQVQFTPGAGGLWIIYELCVSIPHRFNSHYDMEKCNNCDGTVSIPHRFNSHTCKGYPVLYKFWVSIPHRFNSHCLGEVLNYHSRFCFNPSQVQFTHRKFTVKWRILPSFNPSQVQFTRENLN